MEHQQCKLTPLAAKKKKKKKLTHGNNHPDEIHQEIVDPEVVGFRPTVRYSIDVVIEQAGGIVQRIPVQMAQADDYLNRVAQRVLDEDQICNRKAQRTPHKLFKEQGDNSG